MDSTATTTLEELPSPLAASSTDRCPSCGAHMTADQRYCLDCGERRTGGGLREALPRAQSAVAAPAARTRRTFAATPNTSLIAGVGTLLLAMGVGVLIGRSGDNAVPARSAAPQVVTVQTSGAGGASTTAAAAADTASTASKSSSKKKHRSSSKSSSSTTGASDVRKTAAQNGVKLPPPVVKVGSKCQSGAKGCQGGKFTGNFFGG